MKGTQFERFVEAANFRTICLACFTIFGNFIINFKAQKNQSGGA
jgi:hypothetical protein